MKFHGLWPWFFRDNKTRCKYQACSGFLCLSEKQRPQAWAETIPRANMDVRAPTGDLMMIS